MSNKAVGWAMEQPIYHTSAKFVLVAMANFASQDGQCYCAIRTIAEITALHKNTVGDMIEQLLEHDYLFDTKKRLGRTGKVKVYQLPVAARSTTKIADSNGSPGVLLNGSPTVLLDGGNGTERVSQECHSTPPHILLTYGTKKKQEAAPLLSSTRKFTDGWMEGYKNHHECPYEFSGGKDGKAVAKMLKSGDCDSLLDLAEKAWSQDDDRSHWNCVHMSHTIAKFSSALNEIRVELSRGPKKSTGYKGPNI